MAPTSWSGRPAGCATICGAAGSTFRDCRVVVLDEADEMLDLGFREDLEFILETTPDSRRTLLFSATLPRGIVALAKQYQQHAFRIEVAGDEGGHADIEYRAIRVAADDVEHAVVNVLRFHEAPSAHRVLQHSRSGQAFAGGAAGARLLGGCVVG
jgi:superfamily II DNA/RNA helicase